MVAETVVGDMPAEEKLQLRRDWYPLMARNGDEEEKKRFARLAEEGGVAALGDLRYASRHGLFPKTVMITICLRLQAAGQAPCRVAAVSTQAPPTANSISRGRV